MPLARRVVHKVCQSYLMNVLNSDPFPSWSRRIRDSDQQAYTEVFRHLYDPLYRYAWFLTQDQEMSYDVLQDVFLKLWKIRNRLDPERSLKALLFQMVRNTAFNQLRMIRNHAQDSLEDVLYEPAAPDLEDLETSHLEAQIRQWIEELPERRREAFILSRYQGLSHLEIARIMDLTPKTVNNHIVLALQYLRNKLHAYQPELLTS